MKKAILDTNFILSCIRNKLDFFEEINLMGIQIIIPKEIISEIERFKDKKTEAQIALKILGKNKFKKIGLGKGHVDRKIINYAKENPNLIIATLDKEIKEKTKNQKLIIRGNKKLEIV